MDFGMFFLRISIILRNFCSIPCREMTQQEKDDRALAEAIARSEQEARNRSQNNQVWVIN